MAVAISENQLRFLLTTLTNLAEYLEQRVAGDEAAAKQLVELEEALASLQNAEIDRAGGEAIAEGIIATKGGSWIV